MSSVTIKELHQTTGDWVRRAGASKSPVVVTDHGKPVAVLTSPSLLKPKRRRRTLLPEYKALMAKTPGNDLMDRVKEKRRER